MEVGLGGAGDATNVVNGEVAVVTNVSLDHAEYIGPTVADIAREKAGIVKPGATLVLGETDPVLQAPFLDRGAERVLTRGVDFGVRGNQLAHGGRIVDLFTPGATYPDVFLALHGAHQADNAACALAAVEGFLGRPLEAGLVAGAFTVRTPGRLEVVQHQPLVLLDGVKNVAGALALRAALAEEFADAPRTFVVGFMREKAPHEMLEALGAIGGEPRVLSPRQPAGPGARRRRARRDRARHGCRPHRGDRRRARRGPPRDRRERTGRTGRRDRVPLRREPRAMLL
ncbi:MAG: Mur ligase family protein [Acidimicrobiia bacterium]